MRMKELRDGKHLNIEKINRLQIFLKDEQNIQVIFLTYPSPLSFLLQI